MSIKPTTVWRSMVTVTLNAGKSRAVAAVKFDQVDVDS